MKKIWMVVAVIMLGLALLVSGCAESEEFFESADSAHSDLGDTVDTWWPDSIYITGDNITIYISGDNATVIYTDGEQEGNE